MFRMNNKYNNNNKHNNNWHVIELLRTLGPTSLGEQVANKKGDQPIPLFLLPKYQLPNTVKWLASPRINLPEL
jgi:hypothetical protein